MMVITARNEKELQRLVAQIAYRVKKEVIHTFLAEMGIKRLEAILAQAKLNRETKGHNDYTALAEVWLDNRRRIGMTTTTTPVTNPFRHGSKLHDIFNFMADGSEHSLNAITDAGYFPGAAGNPLYRRRTSSAIRTIRAKMEEKNVGTVRCVGLHGNYKLVIR